MNVKTALLTLVLGALAALTGAAPTRAADMPEISPTLKKMLGALPLAEMKDDIQALVPALKKTECGNGLKGCYHTKSGVLQLYYFT
ncbi:MAG: lectin, partial [Oxalobacteraceae bacterium]